MRAGQTKEQQPQEMQSWGWRTGSCGLVLLQGPVDKGGGRWHGTGRDALAAADAHRLLPRSPAL